ncbi:MAG: pyridoxamine 5'-phosphate oxidase family protein [Acidimicrobiia bacterium]|nr:pyridoxamine 5'-phosphate oxidase family protein [Acidimicrobiia bacterium]
MQTTTPTSSPTTTHRPDPERVHRAIEKRSFATLATASSAGRPHVAGVLYDLVDDVLYVNTLRTSRKARNVVANPRVAVVVPIRRLPVGPPSTVQFQADATVVALDDPEIQRLVADGHLGSITGHGELEMADGCFLRIPVPARLVTYGLGMPLRRLITDPMSAGGVVDAGEER